MHSKKTPELVNGLFSKATTPKAYRRAMKALERLPAKAQLECLDEMFAAADRMSLERVSGLPRVKPQGSVFVRGREIPVEVLA